MANTSIADEQALDDITEEQAARYLKNNPDFLLRRNDLLCDIVLTHDSGSAVSLLERQASLLRDRNKNLTSQLSELLSTARSNEQLFEKCRQLILALLDAQSLDAIVGGCIHSLRNHFTMDFVSLIVFGDPQSYQDCTSPIIAIDQAYQAIPSLLKTEQISCGALRPKELQFLFSDQAEQVGSVAVAPLNRVPPLGILAIGNRDPHYFGSTMSTLFLEYIAEVLKRLLPRHMNSKS